MTQEFKTSGYSREVKLIGGLSTLILILCYLSFIGSAMAADTYINTTNIYREVEILGGDDVITPHLHYWDNWFAFYNEDLITYHVYMYNYTGSHPNNYTDSFIGVVKHGQVMMLNDNASYRIFAEYPDEIRLESLDDVKQGVNRYWVIVVVLIIIVVALYTAIRIIRGRKY